MGNSNQDITRYLSRITFFVIGARFYDAIDESNSRNDAIEAELAKDIESTRLFRLVYYKVTTTKITTASYQGQVILVVSLLRLLIF